MHAAQSYGQTDNNLPPQTQYQTGFPDTTIFAALSAKGISNRYFFNDVPVSSLWGAPGLARSGPISEYYERCATGTLPNVSYVDPNFAGSAGEGPDVVHAFMESPQWKRGALFIVYDEWGGFFDHVAPPRVPDARNDADVNKDFGLMGFRIPAVGVSPYLRRGHVAHSTYGFESILKMIEYRFSLAPLTKRDAYAGNIATAFDWRSKPRLELPQLPDPPAVVSVACPPSTPGGAAAQQRPNDHDMMNLVTSGYLERLGFEFKPATPESTYRQPHTVLEAYRGSTTG
jgi:phospholipase C